jgi:hypothetical protein
MSGGLVKPGTMDLQVESGESVLLSPTSARFQAAYQQIRPQTIDQVRLVLGFSENAVKALQAAGTATAPAMATAGTTLRTLSAVIPASDLVATDATTRLQARDLAYQAAGAYITSPNPAHFSQMVPVLNQYLIDAKAILNIISLLNIDVADGATLTISKNTHALYANNIVIHGSGKIVCQGRITFKVSTVQGLHDLNLGDIVSRGGIHRIGQ